MQELELRFRRFHLQYLLFFATVAEAALMNSKNIFYSYQDFDNTVSYFDVKNFYVVRFVHGENHEKGDMTKKENEEQSLEFHSGE